MGVFLLLVLVGMCLISDAWPSYNSEVDYVNGVPTVSSLLGLLD